MLERETTLRHPMGSTVDLPLLVPAFSSKGFGFVTESNRRVRRTVSEISNGLEMFGPFLDESMLISAYDIHMRYYRPAEKALGRKFLCRPSIVFLDSGGYELSPDFDSSEPKQIAHKPEGFSLAHYEGLLRSLQSHKTDYRLVIANFDWGTRYRPFDVQIESAVKLFNEFPMWAGDLILKPHSRNSTVINIDELVPHIGKLRGIPIVGVTEDELGKNLIDRLRRIARLRAELTRHGVSAPIHIWGGLDPVITPLYFFAGADVFDGLSWLRYSYHRGVAVNRQSFSVLEKSLTMSSDHARGLCMHQNLVALQDLATSMRAFFDSGGTRFEVFEHNQEVFEKAYQAMTARIDELKGGA